MSKSSTFSNALLKLIFQGVAIPTICDNAASSPLTQLFISLHTDDPGVGGDQSSNESSYTGYARVALNRNSSDWAVTGISVSPVSDITFPIGTAGSGTVTFVAIGSASSGTNMYFYAGVLSPPILTGAG